MRVLRAKTAGFCQGVLRAVRLAESAARNAGGARVFTLGPLIHNEQEVARLAEMGVVHAEDFPHAEFAEGAEISSHAEYAEGAEISSHAEFAEGAEDHRPRNGGFVGRAPSRPKGADAPIVVLRAHGVSPDRREALERAGCRIVDATCPHVRRIQEIVEAESSSGRTVVVFGDPCHAEVAALLGFARRASADLARRGGLETASPLVRGRADAAIGEADSSPPSEVPSSKKPSSEKPAAVVLSSSADVARLDGSGRPFALVSQSTKPEEEFREMAEALLARFPDSTIHDTVCGATRARLDALEALAAACDAIVVVGSRTSANTRNLAERAAALRPAFSVSGPGEIDPADFAGFQVVGVTAGASTPDSAIEAVVSRLRAITAR